MGADARLPTYAELTNLMRDLRERVAALEVERTQDKKRIAELEAQLASAKKNSHNSSKPPSSDIIKPSTGAPQDTGRRKKRHIGGHNGYREALAEEKGRMDELVAGVLAWVQENGLTRFTQADCRAYLLEKEITIFPETEGLLHAKVGQELRKKK